MASDRQRNTDAAERVRVMIKFTIPGQQIGLNEYINAERSNRYVAAKLKKNIEKDMCFAIKQQLGNLKIENPVFITYTWIEPNRMRDKSNICFAKKFVEDALIKAGVLKNDGWKEIDGFRDYFEVDKENPRVEVEIRLVEK